MSKHTPGPWSYDNLRTIVIHKDGKKKIDIDLWPHQYDEMDIPLSTMVANGRLIAAAPEMYELLASINRQRYSVLSDENISKLDRLINSLQ